MKKIYILTGMLLFITAFGFAQGGSGNGIYRKTTQKGPLVYTPIANTSPAYYLKSLSSPHLMGTTIFTEDFQGGAIPPTFTLINGDNKTPDPQVSFVNAAWVIRTDFDDPNNFAAVSTSYYAPASTSDDWLITPQISIPAGTTRLSWNAKSQDPNFPDGYKVKLSTTGTNKADFTKTLFTIAADNDIWTSRTVDLSIYAGQDVYIAFQNNTFDGFLLFIDDITVFQPDPFDISLSNANTYEYPVSPLKQGFPFASFSGKIANTGGDTVNGAKLDININSGAFTTSATSPTFLLASDTVLLTTITPFVPVAIDTYKVAYTASINETEANLADNTLNNYFVIADSVLAREDGPASGSLGIGSGGGILGQIFTLNKLDTLTSVSFYLRSPNPGDKVSVDIYNFSGVPTNIIASTEEMTIPDTMGRWYTLKIYGNYVPLTADTFFIGVNETNMNITLGTNTKFFKPNTSWVNFGTNGWKPSEFYNFSITYLLRANLGNVVELPPYEVKIASVMNVEYPILPLVQAANANLTFAGVIENVGGITVNNPKLSVDVNSGLHTDSQTILSLNKGDTATFRTLTPFNPPATGIYSVNFTASVSDPETNLLDNTMQNQFEVSDSIMAREIGGSTGTLGIGDGIGGTLGQTFTLNAGDTITSVSFYLRNPTKGDKITADIYNFSGVPTNIIASTVEITIPDTIARWYTLKIDGNFYKLSAGTFFVGVNEKANNIKLGTNNNYFVPNTAFVNFTGNPWSTNESLGFKSCYMLRPNFGKVVPLPNYDVKISNPNTYEYTLLPLKQAQGMGFSARIKNIGGLSVSNAKLNVNVNSGAYSDNSVTATLNPKDTATFRTVNPFNAPAAGTYTIDYTASVSNNELYLTDNKTQSQFEVSDTVFARESGASTGALGIGDGTGGTLGQIFTLTNNDSMTSVSFYLKTPTKGDTIIVNIYDFDTIPNNVIASCNPLVVPSTTGKWYTVRIKGNFVALSPGTYFVGVEEKKHNISLGTNNKYFTPNTGWVSFGGNPWQPSEFYGFEVTYLLRPNFGKVVQLPAFEAGIQSALSPATGSCLGMETVKVTIVNNGANTIQNFPVSFKVDNGAAVTESVSASINSTASLVYTFTAKANLSTSGNHTIKVYTGLTGDNSHNNDTIKFTVNNIPSVTPTYNMGFEPNEVLAGWSILDVGQDGNTWKYAMTGGNNFDGCVRFDGGSAAANDFVFSQCIDLDSTKTYEVSFSYRANLKTSVERLRFKMGQTASVAGMVTTIKDFPVLNDTVYNQFITSTLKAKTGTYYFGWLVYSLAGKKGIRIDDFLIDEVVGIDEVSANKNNISLSPNPASNFVTLSSQLPIKNIRVVNSLGQLVNTERGNGNSMQIDTKDFAIGIYILQIETREGTTFHKLNISR
jgi:hypothetical protein